MIRVTASLLLLAAAASPSPLPRVTTPANPQFQGTNLLWRNPGQVSSLDLAHGVGGRAQEPKPPFKFVKEDLSGSNPKIEVKDARGITWNVKWSDEAQAEVFSSRLAWACGYVTQPEYFVASGHIQSVKAVTRARSMIAPDGSFRDARFQVRSKYPKFLKHSGWSWAYNPFVGTRELNGLKVLMMLTSNWDNKDARDIDRDSNLAIFEAGTKRRPVYQYFVADWGATMGRWGSVVTRSKWDCKGYAQQSSSFVKRRNDGRLLFGYSGQHTEDAARDVRVSDVAWLLGYLGRITDAQIRSGLLASGATRAEVECFTRSLRSRIDQLREVSR